VRSGGHRDPQFGGLNTIPHPPTPPPIHPRRGRSLARARFNAGVTTGLSGGGCVLVGQRATLGDSNCTRLDPAFSFEGYLRDLSLWSTRLTSGKVGGCVSPLPSAPSFPSPPCSCSEN
jgi:hypothetical protein